MTDDFDNDELTPEQREAMEIRLKELCLDCLGDGWVWVNPCPGIGLRATCGACKGTGSVDNNLHQADTGEG